MRICWAQYTLWGVIIVLATLGMLAGCGAKGDLYLPPEEKVAPAPVEPQPEPEQTQPQPEAQLQ